MKSNRQESPDPVQKSIPSLVPSVLLFAIIVGLMSYSASREHLSRQEARFLNEVIEFDDTATLPVRVQDSWADFCGLMERPSRLLGLIAAVGGLLLLLNVIRRGGGSIFLGLTIAGAFGVIIVDGVTIGASAPAFLGLAAVAYVIHRLLGLSLFSLSVVSLVILLVFQFAVAGQAASDSSWSSWQNLGPNLGLWGLPAWSGLASFGSLVVAAFLCRQDYRGLGLLALAVAAVPMARRFGIQALPTSWVLSAYAVPITLLLTTPEKNRPTPKLLTAVGLILTLIVLGAQFEATRRSPSTRLDRERLDWVADTLPKSAWLVLDGDRRDVLLYYEQSGHRTGHRWILVKDQADLKTLVRVALSEKPPMICLIDTDPKSLTKLRERYELVEPENLPTGITFARFKRRG